MRHLLERAAEELCFYLERVFSTIPNWQALVWSALCDQERKYWGKKKDSLSQLDLKALLRILTEKWREISLKKSLPREVPGYIQKMKEVRNRWFHSPSRGCYELNVVRKDLSTLGQLLCLIKADYELVEQVETEKEDLGLCGAVTKSTCSDRQPMKHSDLAAVVDGIHRCTVCKHW
jgi:hypothetical protein